MKNLFKVIKEIWTVDELKKRIIYTLSLILVYRIGSYIVLPGIDVEQLNASGGADNSILNLINMFAGGAFSRASIMALGIMPYISASIVMQLLGMAVPTFQRLQREGESGRKKINLKGIVDEALNDCSCIEKVLVVNRINAKINMKIKPYIFFIILRGVLLPGAPDPVT